MQLKKLLHFATFSIERNFYDIYLRNLMVKPAYFMKNNSAVILEKSKKIYIIVKNNTQINFSNHKFSKRA